MVREVASRTSDLAGDGTTTATVLAQAIVREGTKAVAAGMNPMDLKRGIDMAVEAVVDRHQEGLEEGLDQRRDRPGRHDLGQQRPRDRRDDRQGDAEGRQRRRHHGRGGEVDRDRARDRRGHAVRPRLHLALFHHQPREDDGRARRSLHSAAREEAAGPAGHPAAARSRGPERQGAADRRRGHRRRGAGDARGQQASRRPQGGGGEGTRASAIGARRCWRISPS